MLQLTPLALAPLGVGALGVYPLGVAGEVVKRWAFGLDGLDDRMQSQFRAFNIDQPVVVSWAQKGMSVADAAPKNIVSQCLSATITERETYLRWLGNNGALNWNMGSIDVGPGGILAEDGNWTATYNDPTSVIQKNSVMVATKNVAKGTARELAAKTVVGARASGNGYLEFFNGFLYNLQIGSTFWPLDQKDQLIQLPVPSGLGAELVTEVNHLAPASKGSHWTYLGAGRWQYVGDGNSNSLTLIGTSATPAAMLVELEVESYTGASTMRMTANVAGIGDRLFSSVGKKRFYFINDEVPVIRLDRNVAGQVISCIIKDISFKPLVASYGVELALGGDFSNPAQWGTPTANVTISGGKLNFTGAGIGAGVPQAATIADNKLYEVTYTIDSITGGSVRVRLIGNTQQYSCTARTVAGTYTELIEATEPYGATPTNRIRFEAQAAGTNAVIDNISVREVTAYCNPFRMINTNNANWQEIEV